MSQFRRKLNFFIFSAVSELNSSIHDWPHRWHQIVEEYNTSFEHQQNEMRVYFESKFDQIRRDNDMYLSQMRLRRDKCAQRLCDLIDTLDSLCNGIASNLHDLKNSNEQISSLNSELVSLNDEYQQISAVFTKRKHLLKMWTMELKTEESVLETQKAELRDEIRDLKGFLVMNSQLSTIASGGMLFRSLSVLGSREVDRGSLLLLNLLKTDGLKTQFSTYLKAKDEFDFLVDKYQIFGSKEKSTADAANLVGLRVPIEYKEPS